jgi:hypothetical protein
MSLLWQMYPPGFQLSPEVAGEILETMIQTMAAMEAADDAANKNKDAALTSQNLEFLETVAVLFEATSALGRAAELMARCIEDVALPDLTDLEGTPQ